MHSLKNTVVAVGLLGLSFLFYQASSTKPTGETGLMPAIDISEGINELGNIASGPIDAIQSSVESMPTVNIPGAGDSKQFVSEIAGNARAQLDASASELKSHANDFAKNALPDLISTPNQFGSQFSAQTNGNIPTGSAPNGNFQKALTPPPAQQSFPQAGNNSLQLTDSAARDAGLIEALKSQSPQPTVTTSTTNHPTTDHNSFSPQPMEKADDSAFQFASQPIPSNDSSFNRLASNDAGNKPLEVVQANVNPTADTANLNFQDLFPHVDQMANDGKFRDALRLLSRYYRSTELNGPQRQRLIGYLDGFSGKVIFSAEHHLHQPYTVSNESLAEIANRLNVTPQLIFNTNRATIGNNSSAPPGTELKIIQGPFNAEIDMQRKVMTLFLDDLYAGRYPVKIGISGQPKPGSYQVLVKSEAGHSWRDVSGKEYPPSAPENGYGPNWIGLSGSLCIHAVDDSIRDGHSGCIGLSEKDAKDIFTILSKGSSVKILR